MGQPTAKKAKVSGNSAKDLLIPLGRSRYLTVKKYRGLTYVHIREFGTNPETGDLIPSKRGITLLPEEWSALKQGALLVDSLIKTFES